MIKDSEQTESQKKSEEIKEEQKFDSIEEALSKNLAELEKIVSSKIGKEAKFNIKNLAIVYTVDDPTVLPVIRFHAGMMKFKDMIVGASLRDLYQIACQLKVELESVMLLQNLKEPMEGLATNIVRGVVQNVLPNMQTLFKTEFNNFLVQFLSKDKDFKGFFMDPTLLDPTKKDR